MKGKVILELEEYEDLVRKNSNEITTIIEKTEALNKIKKEINNAIIGRKKYMGGYIEYFMVNDDELIKIAKKQFLKSMSVKEFKKLKNSLTFV